MTGGKLTLRGRVDKSTDLSTLCPLKRQPKFCADIHRVGLHLRIEWAQKSSSKTVRPRRKKTADASAKAALGQSVEERIYL